MDTTEADRLAKEALAKKKPLNNVERAQQESEKFEGSLFAQLEVNY
jgi:hypothetical protein